MTDFLSQQPARSLHRYVLLDAQDWMTDEILSGILGLSSGEIGKLHDDKVVGGPR